MQNSRFQMEPHQYTHAFIILQSHIWMQTSGTFGKDRDYFLFQPTAAVKQMINKRQIFSWNESKKWIYTLFWWAHDSRGVYVCVWGNIWHMFYMRTKLLDNKPANAVDQLKSNDSILAAPQRMSFLGDISVCVGMCMSLTLAMLFI